MVRRLILAILCATMQLGLAAQVVFNRTEHDFGAISPTAAQFEQDFIFRNTGSNDARILSVKSVQPALQFIYTRSDVLSGEYGFVKVKIHPDSLSGLFHDEVYITMKYGDEVLSEVLYLRAQIEEGGQASDNRAFEDGAISTSVEVSPDDIETMEGFMGGDKLSQAESEIEYLRKQVAMKSDLIAKLSDDLFKKQAQEQENFNRLATLERTLRENKSKGNQEALAQLDELTDRLTDMRSSDSLLRQEIREQERAYDQLKAEADSARAYAKDLSAQLQERFESEARAMEKAQQLEADLKAKEETEQQQQARIDSLTRVLAMAGDNSEVSKEIERLQKELAWKKKEQEMQAEHAAKQRERIEALRKENEYFKQSTDSLTAFAESSADENDRLQQQLEQSNSRIRSYESVIDSLRTQASAIDETEQSAIEELERLKQELAAVEAQDQELKKQITSKEEELKQLQGERDAAKKNMEALERVTTKQQEQAQNLLHRINSLSSKESQAQLEVKSLKLALKESEYREDSTRQSVNELVAKISERESSIQSLSDEINQKEAELASMRKEREQTAAKLREAQAQSSKDAALIDSLTTALNQKSDGTSMLENDIIVLQKQVLASKNKEQDYKDRAAELESRLTNAHLSNDLTFKELKADVDAMRNERDDYRDKYKSAVKEIEQLMEELEESKRNEESAIAFANELQAGATVTHQSGSATTSEVVYSINVLSSDRPVNMGTRFEGEEHVREYMEGGRYRYAIGAHSTLKAAIAQKEALKAKGYPMSFIVAFRDGQRISLKEALESSPR